MYEIEFAEDQSNIGLNDKRIFVLGNRFVGADGSEGRYGQYAVVSLDSLTFINGRWYVPKVIYTEAVEQSFCPKIKVNWSKFDTLQQDIQANYTVENEQPALTDES